MKKVIADLSVPLFLFAALIFLPIEAAEAEVASRDNILTRTASDEDAKTYVLNMKAKIAQERNAILAAYKRLKEAKKTKDKVLIAQVKQEVDKEIKDRKAVIKTLYDDIKNKIGQTDSFIPGRKDRAKR